MELKKGQLYINISNNALKREIVKILSVNKFEVYFEVILGINANILGLNKWYKAIDYFNSEYRLLPNTELNKILFEVE